MTPRLREQARRAVQVITVDGAQLSGGRAMLFILEEIGWHPHLASVAQRRPFVWLVELGYRLVARNRPVFDRLLFPSRRG